ncbi:MAG: hypothetical protein ABEJ88_07230 [Halobacterium sp.]
MRRTLATLAVAALLVTAGCSAFGGGGTDATTTSPPAGDAGDPVYETPLNASAVADEHLAALEAAGSYTVESTAVSESSARNATRETNTVIRGDLGSGAVFTRTAARQQVVEGYAFANGTGYQRFEMPDQTRYVNATGRLGNASQYARGTVASFVGLFEFSYAGTTTENGQTVHVYEAEGASSLNTSAPAFASLNESNVKAANATLHVRSDGVVVLASYDITVSLRGNTQRVDATQRFTNVGSTDVSPPAWIPEARANVTA